MRKNSVFNEITVILFLALFRYNFNIKDCVFYTIKSKHMQDEYKFVDIVKIIRVKNQ